MRCPVSTLPRVWVLTPPPRPRSRGHGLTLHCRMENLGAHGCGKMQLIFVMFLTDPKESSARQKRDGTLIWKIPSLNDMERGRFSTCYYGNRFKRELVTRLLFLPAPHRKIRRRPPPSQWVELSRKVHNTMTKQQEAAPRVYSWADNDELQKVKEIIVLGQTKAETLKFLVNQKAAKNWCWSKQKIESLSSVLTI